MKLKVAIPIVSNSLCSEKFHKLTANQICAGGVAGKDSCSGDSGGPLLNFYGRTFGEQKQWYQEGIVARGALNCGTAGLPAIYTRTARYVNWVENNIRD